MAKKKEPKKQIAGRIERELAERAERCAYWIGRGLTFAAILENGLRREVEWLERTYNDGKPFEPVEETPRSPEGT